MLKDDYDNESIIKDILIFCAMPFLFLGIVICDLLGGE